MNYRTGYVTRKYKTFSETTPHPLAEPYISEKYRNKKQSVEDMNRYRSMCKKPKAFKSTVGKGTIIVDGVKYSLVAIKTIK